VIELHDVMYSCQWVRRDEPHHHLYFSY